MATHFSIIAWEIPWTEEPGGLQSLGSQKCRKQLSTHTQGQQHWYCVSVVSLGGQVGSAAAWSPACLWLA